VSVESVDLRRAMRDFATGVCIATTFRDTAQGRQDDAITINSLTSLSLDPPLVSLCVRGDSSFLSALLDSGVWAVSILGAGSEDVARALAQNPQARGAVVRSLSAVRGERTGALVLDGPSRLECELRDQVRVGDHVMVIGDVVSSSVQPRRPPLIFLRGRYFALENVH
jgi:flavin reductase (DIM6/NTAB) family NADH-FMN oxidoreductase RutF